mmetsp:Transcript_108587/g.212767  ORF Transcript_108587/g.212767 Transcript_108587/m.212767 type:complete len:82 (+) Transcript_108587:85-330(+)
MEVTREEVAMHSTETDCWVIINGEVLDVTGFLLVHPGGSRTLMSFAGKDATEEFSILHHPNAIKQYGLDTGVVKAMGRLRQ